eukprot:gnl/MRDRNA2_/MRDRNA2_36992_c0_seq1.p1 gnl/MRDRNA2_/MRDRNA2_36992_c0~~gnl/MRDRNA2_/MRDRNA2_36992_c0_seq1.p1  ORF type:complete len:516 (+),score=75.25 gnl/MRDRNA2_/MRDRNA2_36992_c0_seq1:88-1635(+)
MTTTRNVFRLCLHYSGLVAAFGTTNMEQAMASAITLQQPASRLQQQIVDSVGRIARHGSMLPDVNGSAGYWSIMRRETQHNAHRRRHHPYADEKDQYGDQGKEKRGRQSVLHWGPPAGHKKHPSHGDAVAESTVQSQWDRTKQVIKDAAVATAGLVIRIDAESKRKSKGRIGVIEILASCAAFASCAGFIIARCMFRSPNRSRPSLAPDNVRGSVTRTVMEAANQPQVELLDNVAPAPQDGPDAADAAAGGPTQRQGNADFNRQQYLRNRREAEAQAWEQALSDSQALFCLIAMWPVILLFVFVYFWARGWDTWWHFGGSECDKPLGSWLFVTLLWPFWPRGSPWVALLALIGWITLGVVWLNETVTCSRTAPELFDFVRLLLIILAALWVMLLVGCLTVRLAMDCLLCCGWVLKTRAEILDFIETVTYDPSLFASPDGSGISNDDLPAGECCCCTEAFGHDKTIKFTPCKHYFHEECLGKWMRVSPTCPLCRSDLVEAVRIHQEQMEAAASSQS